MEILHFLDFNDHLIDGTLKSPCSHVGFFTNQGYEFFKNGQSLLFYHNIYPGFQMLLQNKFRQV